MPGLALALIALAHAAPVVVVRADLPPGVPLQAKDLELAETPVELLMSGPTFKRVSDAVGRIPVDWLYSGEVLRGERLAEAGSAFPEGMLRPGEHVAHVTIDVPAAWAPVSASVDVEVREKDYGCRAVEAGRILGVTTSGGRATAAVLAVPEGSQLEDGAVATLSLRSPSDTFVGSSKPNCDAGPPAPPEIPVAVGRSLLIPVGPDAGTIEPERFGIVDAQLHEGYLHVIGLAEGTGRVAIETPWGDDVRVFRVVPVAEWDKLRVAGTRESWTLPAGGAVELTEPTTWTAVADPAVASVVDDGNGHQLLVGLSPGATDVALGAESSATLRDVLVTRPRRDATYGPDISQIGGKILVPLPEAVQSTYVVDPGVLTLKPKKGGTLLEVRGATEGYTQLIVYFAHHDPLVKDILVGRPPTVEWTKAE